MEGLGHVKRFGSVAIEKGFINKQQLFEVMKIQILKGDQSEPIGSILYNLRYMTPQQIDEVVESLPKKYECPNCGIAINECPNCGSILM